MTFDEAQERIQFLKREREKLKQRTPKPPVQNTGISKPSVMSGPSQVKPYHSLPLPPREVKPALPRGSICPRCGQEKKWVADSDGIATQVCWCRSDQRTDPENYNIFTNDHIMPFMARENGRFGSMSSSDDYSEESGPEVDEY